MGSLLCILYVPFTLRSMCSIHLRPNYLTTPQAQQKQSQASGADVAAPLCCPQGLFPRGSHGPLNRDGLQRTVDVVTIADQANAGALVTGSSATRWKRVVSHGTTSVGVERSSILSNGVSTADGTHFIPLCSSATPSANITSSSISSTHEAISTKSSAQLVSTLASLSSFTPSLFSTCIPQTPFPSPTLTETLMTSATFPSSASPIVTSRSLTSLRSSTSTSATSFRQHHHSTVTVITFTTVRPQPSPSFTMSNSDTITLAPVNPTSTVIGPGISQSGSDTSFISSISSTPFVIPTFVSSTTVFSPIPPTSVFLTSIASPIASPYPSISAISLSSISDDPTITSTSTSAVDQTMTISSSETGALSTNRPNDTDFAHQTGAIIGVTIGGAFFLFIIILSIFFACKRYRSDRSYNSSMEDILAASRGNTSWHPPLADDDEHYLAAYGGSTSPNYPKPSGSQDERGPFDDPLPIEGGRSGGGAESAADANGALVDFGSQPPVTQTLHGSSTHSRVPLLSPSHSSNDSHGNSRPWWGNTTEPLNIHKRNNSQKSPLTVDSHVSAIGRRSVSSLGFGGSTSSNGHLGPGSSGETLLPRGTNRSTSIPEPPRPIHKLSGRRYYSTPPTAFVGRNSSLEYGTQPIQHQQQQQQQPEEQNQQDHGNKSLSQVILARIRASRRSSNASTVKAYSQCTTLESEESAPSRTSSYMMYSPSLLNPPISMSQTVVPLPRGGVTRGSHTNFPSPPSLRQDTSSRGVLRWPDVSILPPPSPSPVPTDTSSSMVEGLLHPRLGMALASSQQASATSLRDHEDYTRPINGLVNNHIRSTTTFETQNTVDLNEGGT